MPEISQNSDDTEFVEDLGDAEEPGRFVEPKEGVSTRSRIRNSEAASAQECLYVNFMSTIEPKKLVEALAEEGWLIAMQE